MLKTITLNRTEIRDYSTSSTPVYLRFSFKHYMTPEIGTLVEKCNIKQTDLQFWSSYCKRMWEILRSGLDGMIWTARYH